MKQQHPITPPPELAAEWVAEIYGDPAIPLHPITLQLVQRAAQWGADQELEACCECMNEWGDIHNCFGGELADDLRADRRPKPPTLKEQALEALKHAEEGWRPVPDDCALIRRALMALPDEP